MQGLLGCCCSDRWMLGWGDTPTDSGFSQDRALFCSDCPWTLNPILGFLCFTRIIPVQPHHRPRGGAQSLWGQKCRNVCQVGPRACSKPLSLSVSLD